MNLSVAPTTRRMVGTGRHFHTYSYQIQARYQPRRSNEKEYKENHLYFEEVKEKHVSMTELFYFKLQETSPATNSLAGRKGHQDF